MGSCVQKLAEGQLPARGAAGSPEKRKANYEVKENGKPDSEKAEQNPKQVALEQRKPPSFADRKKRDLSNFQFKDEKEKFLYKPPGSLNGQQFRILNCSECNLYVHDNHDSATVDYCVNSVIVMGPCVGSTFIRNCKDCKIILTCQQLRVRDCQNVEIMLYSQTQPVIESSSNLTFFCHQYFYPELPLQMKAARLSYLNNKWTDIYDFTPNKLASQGLNYSIVPEATPGFVSSLSMMQKVITAVEKAQGFKVQNLKQIAEEDLINIEIEDEVESDLTLIPHTIGSSDWPSTEECFIFVFLQKPEDIYAEQTTNLIFSMQRSFLDNQAYWIQDSRSTELTQEQLKELQTDTGLPSKIVSKDKVTTLGIHLKANNKADGYQTSYQKLLTQIISANQSLRLEATCEPSKVKRAHELLFKTFNIEHTGHNIAASGGK